jgi:hypothetical protein
MQEWILWVTRPNVPSDLLEVVPGMVEVAWYPADTFAARSDPASRMIDASLVEDLTQAVGKVRLATVGIELPG